MWIPARATVPPERTARRAAGTISPAGAKTMAESSDAGIGSVAPPTHAAPRRRARARWRSPRAGTNTSAPRGRATWSTTWADDAEPQSPNRAPGRAGGAIAEDARAEEGRGLAIAEPGGDRIGEGLGHHCQLGVAAVDVVARVARRRAEVLPAGTARHAAPAGRAEPRDADAVAG